MTRRERSLWGLATVAAVQLLLTTLLAAAFGLLFGTAALLIEMLASDRAAGSALAVGELGDAVIGVSAFVERWSAALTIGAVGVFVLWVALGIADVVTVGGLVSESDAAVRGERTSLRRGLSTGARLGWRTAALYAIAALPSLMMAFVMALVLYVPLIGPMRGESLPEPGVYMAGLQLTQPVSAVSSLFSLVLSVIVLFALRFAIVGDHDWKRAISSAWDLVRSHPAEVGLFYFTIAVVNAGVGIVLAILAGAGVLVSAWVVAAGFAAGSPAVGVAVAVVLSLLCAVLSVVVMSALLATTNTACTIAWNQLRSMPTAMNARPYRALASATAADGASPLDGVPPARPLQDGSTA